MLRELPLFQKLQSLELSPSDYTIFGSGSMFAYGIRPISELHDLDIVVTGPSWMNLAQAYPPVHDDEWECDWIYLFDKELELANGWGPGIWDIQGLIQNSEEIDGFNFVNLQDVLKWKKEMSREKDIQHIRMIEAFLQQTNG